MNLSNAIQTVTDHRDLSEIEMSEVMKTIMTGGATPAQIGGFLIGLRMKGETVAEIASAATVMRELATRVPVAPDHLVDTCGTGGDAKGTFNISTAAAIVAAAAGARVAKHGNRAVSGKSGSADVLEAAGVRLDLTPEQVGRCIDEVGIGFLFAQNHHGAMRHAIGPRREMGVRTVFNLLGPLTNPSGAPNQILGVFAEEWVSPLAEVLGRLGSRHAMVVHAEEGMDEISVSGPTRVAELKGGTVTTYTLTPSEFGMSTSGRAELSVETPADSLALIRTVLGGARGPARDVVALNAGAALYVAGVNETLKAGVAAAEATIASGKAGEKLEALIAFCADCDTGG